jgi:hypothetical protein
MTRFLAVIPAVFACAFGGEAAMVWGMFIHPYSWDSGLANRIATFGLACVITLMASVFFVGTIAILCGVLEGEK